MTQTMSDKLELIARCLRDGVEVEHQTGLGCHWILKNFAHSVHVYYSSKYRAKPVKPRLIEQWQYESILIPFDAVELTPEVRQALKDAEVEI
jgi:hypothetical protein